MKKIYFLILILFLVISCSKSPEELKQDSDRFFNQAIDYYERGYLNQSADLLKKVIHIENKLGNNQRKGNCYIYLGLIDYQVSNYNSARNNYEKALSIFRSLKDKRTELVVMNNLAGIHSLLGEYEEAIKIYSEIIGKSLIFADKESEAIASLNLGDLYQELWDFEKSFEYFDRAYNAYEILGSVKDKIYTLNKIGELFIVSKNYSGALKTFDMAIEILNKSGEKYLIQEIYNNIGLIYFYEGQISKAKEFFELAFNLIPSSNSNQQILISLKNNLGDCEYQNQVFSKAIEHYKIALSYSESSYLKYLSPVIQLKIAKSYEQLYFVNSQENDRKLAERFFQFAINRFEEIHDWKNLQCALSSVANFYFRLDDLKSSAEYFKRLQELKILIDLKPDDNLKSFALKPEFDFSFIPALIDQNKIEEVFKLIESLKFQNAFEYFLRFQSFNFLEEILSKKVENLKKDFLLLNTYQKIFTQEISLPASQRIKEKIRIASKKIEETNKRTEEIIESLLEELVNYKFLFLNGGVTELVKDSSKIYVELIPVEQSLICFFLSSSGLSAKVLRLNMDNLKFNLQILSGNLENFTFDELKNFSVLNFSQIADEILSEIYSKHSGVKEIISLINQKETDFLLHLFYSKKYNQFISQNFDVSYSFFIPCKIPNKELKSMGLLKDGILMPSNELVSTKRFKNSIQLNTEKKVKIKQGFRIGLQEKIKIEDDKNNPLGFNNLNGVIVFDDLVINNSTPELTYFESKNKQTRFLLRRLMDFRVNFILIRSLRSIALKELAIFLSLFSFSEVALMIIPISESPQEITENFLYNYITRVENKDLKFASLEFFDKLKNETKIKSKTDLLWIKFIN